MPGDKATLCLFTFRDLDLLGPLWVLKYMCRMAFPCVICQKPYSVWHISAFSAMLSNLKCGALNFAVVQQDSLRSLGPFVWVTACGALA